MTHPVAATPHLISVLIPLYNHERYLERCLESVVADPYPAKELIVIDDGSRDGSAELVARWQAEGRSDSLVRFRFIKRENRGLTRTLNELVSLASGEYLTILGSDDYLVSGGLQARVDYLLGHRHKMAVFGDCLVVDEHDVQTFASGLEGLFRGRKAYLCHERLVSYELVFHWCVPGPVFMAHRELYRMVGGYNEQLKVEDWDFYLRLASLDLIGFVDATVAAYRVHSKSYSRSPESTKDYHLSTLEAVTCNLERFSGLRRVYLLGERLKLLGVIARHGGDSSPGTFLMRKLGRLLLVGTKRLYHLVGPVMLRR